MSDKVEPFNQGRRKPAGMSVDLDAPFFSRRKEPPRDYSKCDHTRLGFEYDVKHRKVFCRCGDEVDPFDAIVALAHAEERLQSTRAAIEEERRRKAEEKAKRPFMKEVRGFTNNYGSDGAPLSRTYRLECGHHVTQHHGRGFRRHWRKATCRECWRQAELAQQGVASVGSQK